MQVVTTYFFRPLSGVHSNFIGTGSHAMKFIYRWQDDSDELVDMSWYDAELEDTAPNQLTPNSEKIRQKMVRRKRDLDSREFD